MEDLEFSASDRYLGMLTEQKDLDAESKEIMASACEAIRGAVRGVEFFTAWEALVFVLLEYEMEEQRMEHRSEHTPLIFIDPAERS